MEESTLLNLPWAQGQSRLQPRPHPGLAPPLPRPVPSQYAHPPSLSPGSSPPITQGTLNPCLSVGTESIIARHRWS